MAKAITLKQPWAELVVLGAKWIETRSWKTEYTGPLYIHASGHFYFSDLELCYQDEDFHAYIPSPHTLQVGKIIGRVYLNGCREAEIVAEILDRRQLVFGDFSPGRWAWELSHPEKLANPIKCRGALSIWDFDDRLLTEHFERSVR